MSPMSDAPPTRQFYLHLVSDATGTTLQGLAKAVLAQFDNIEPIERFWPLTRTERQLERVIGDLAGNPGPVLFTLVDQSMRRRLQKSCQELKVPAIPVLDPLLRGLSAYLGQAGK